MALSVIFASSSLASAASSGIAFSMMNDGETVQCQISDAAMDELAGVRGTQSISRQAQFVTHRDAIERIASDLFDKAPSMKGYVVRIFSKHIQGGRQP